MAESCGSPEFGKNLEEEHHVVPKAEPAGPTVQNQDDTKGVEETAPGAATSKLCTLLRNNKEMNTGVLTDEGRDDTKSAEETAPGAATSKLRALLRNNEEMNTGVLTDKDRAKRDEILDTIYNMDITELLEISGLNKRTTSRFVGKFFAVAEAGEADSLPSASAAAVESQSSPDDSNKHSDDDKDLSTKKRCTDTITNDSHREPQLPSTSVASLLPEIPCYKGYQLLGDTHLLRFAMLILDMENYVTRSNPKIGHCVAGLTTRALYRNLLKKRIKLSKKVIMLIGTTDFLANVKMEFMFENYTRIVNFLKGVAEKVVLLTVPPILKFARTDPEHFQRLKTFNDFISGFADGRQVFVIDTTSIFMNSPNNICEKYFKKFVRRNFRMHNDLTNLNKHGLLKLQIALKTNYFDIIECN